ncbi:hypothetical protein ACN28S_55280 [Cystobacter fuscus]
MQVPQDNFMTFVNRMSHALEQPVGARSATGMLRDLVRSAADAVHVAQAQEERPRCG